MLGNDVCLDFNGSKELSLVVGFLRLQAVGLLKVTVTLFVLLFLIASCS